MMNFTDQQIEEMKKVYSAAWQNAYSIAWHDKSNAETLNTTAIRAVAKYVAQLERQACADICAYGDIHEHTPQIEFNSEDDEAAVRAYCHAAILERGKSN